MSSQIFVIACRYYAAPESGLREAALGGGHIPDGGRARGLGEAVATSGSMSNFSMRS